jgi:membrane dipeptidase
MGALGEKYGPESELAVDRVPAYLAERRVVEARYPAKRATFDDYMAHLLHILKVAGVDHVGIGADWDGGGGVAGLEDVSALPKITEALLAAGYTEQDVRKIWSGNLLRVIREAQAIASSEG